MEDHQFRNAMGNFATGITVITTVVENEVYGMTANAFTSVSLDPKLVLISIANKAKMLTHIQQSKKFAVNFLASDQRAVSMQFAGQIKDAKPYEFDWFNSHPVIKDALANITCSVKSEYVAGDHTLLIGEVTYFQLKDGEPLLFYQGKYHELKHVE